MSITVIAGKKYVKMINLETGHTLYSVAYNQKPLFYKGVGMHIQNEIISNELADENSILIETLIPCSSFLAQMAKLQEDVKSGLISEDNMKTYLNQVECMKHYNQLVEHGFEVDLDITNGNILITTLNTIH